MRPKNGHEGCCHYELQPDSHQLRCVRSDACRPLWLMIAETRELTLRALAERGMLKAKQVEKTHA